MLGSGGKVALGTTVGSVGMLGSGGREGLGSEGCWVVGKVGNVGCGRDGIEGNGGNGGNGGLGKLGTEGKGGNCRRWRAASPRESDTAMKRAKMKQLRLAILMLSLKAWKRVYEQEISR